MPPRMGLEQQRWRVAARIRCEGRGHPLTAPQGVRPSVRPRKNVAGPFRFRSLLPGSRAAPGRHQDPVFQDIVGRIVQRDAGGQRG